MSLGTGLVYAYTKRPTWWGVSAWYLTGIDVRTGRAMFAVRTGTGLLLNDDRAALALAPDGTAYVATLGGMVRRARPPGQDPRLTAAATEPPIQPRAQGCTPGSPGRSMPRRSRIRSSSVGRAGISPSTHASIIAL